MNNVINVSFPWQEDTPSAEALRLEKIRQVSNVIQALENVAVQCENDEGEFDWLRRSINGFLLSSKRKLHQLIHQPT